MAVRAVLFDMDGVLIDSEPAHYAATQEVLRDARLPVPGDDDWESVFFGRPDRDGFHDWQRMHALEMDVRKLMAIKAARMRELFMSHVQGFEDGQWLARELHARGIPLAIVTGGRREEVERVLDRFDLRKVFTATVSADEWPTGKPDPGPYLAGAELLGTPPGECAVIEDAVAGMHAGLAAGAAVVVVVDRLGTPERFAPLAAVTQLDEAVLAGLVD
jgi:HAD superfamily hydrolase (TIGR01509 family)